MVNKSNKLLAGCVILYNPTISVIENIESYIDALAVLYIVDNSDAPDAGLMHQLCAISGKVIYLPQIVNTGVAAALNTGVEQASAAGYDWLLTMDQDSRFMGDDFFNLWQAEITALSEVGLVAASYTDYYDRWQKEYAANFNEIHFVITSGNIINLKACKRVNGFEEQLFIDEIDHDYCLKLRHHHYKVLITKKILLAHAIGHVYKKDSNRSKEIKNVNLHPPLRYYYMSRNVLYMCKKYMFIDFKFVLSRFFYLLRMLGKIILRYPDKGRYLKFFFAGVRDFALSNYYKYKEE